MPTASMATPSVKALARMDPRETSFMRFRARRSGHVAAVPATRHWVPAAAVPQALFAAIVRAEDPRFLDHRGLDWPAIAGAVSETVRSLRLGGGASTITQQLARNLYLTPTKSFTRKLREMWLAHRLEQVLSKTRILEIYVNVAEWGPDIWGCAAAAAHYFGRPVRDLDLFESTFLATLLPAPRAGLSGPHAARSRRVQVSLAHKLLLCGIADAAACASCCARVRDLHVRLAAGTALLPALAASAGVSAPADARFLSDIVARFDLVSPVSPDGRTPWYGDRRSKERALARLRACFGNQAVHELMKTGSYAALRTHPAALWPSEAGDDHPEIERPSDDAVGGR